MKMRIYIFLFLPKCRIEIGHYFECHNTKLYGFEKAYEAAKIGRKSKEKGSCQKWTEAAVIIKNKTKRKHWENQILF